MKNQNTVEETVLLPHIVFPVPFGSDTRLVFLICIFCLVSSQVSDILSKDQSTRQSISVALDTRPALTISHEVQRRSHLLWDLEHVLCSLSRPHFTKFSIVALLSLPSVVNYGSLHR